MNDAPAERGAENIWTRLRRRKVVQWGVAYAAGAWLLMQVLEYFGGTFHWPEQIQQLTTLALLIGLPIVLVGAAPDRAFGKGDDAALRARMGAAGRARVLDRFTWRATAEATVAVYRELLAHR